MHTRRLDKMINLLPKAIEQANSRIISNKVIKNEDILVYHDNVNVIKRGKPVDNLNTVTLCL